MAAPTPPPRELSDIDLPIPDKWFAQVAVDESDQAVHSGWVRSFDDQVLHKLIDRALVDNFDLKATAARVEAAMAQARSQLAQAQNQVQLIIRQLEILLGDYPEGAIPAIDTAVITLSASTV